LLLQQFGMKV